MNQAACGSRISSSNPLAWKGRKKPPDDPGNPTVNFHGEKRSNDTHVSTTDPESKLARKGNNGAKLSYSTHVLMENRNGLCADVSLAPATGDAEWIEALRMLDRQRKNGINPSTLGCDKGYDVRSFDVRARPMRPVHGLRPGMSVLFPWPQKR